MRRRTCGMLTCSRATMPWLRAMQTHRYVQRRSHGRYGAAVTSMIVCLGGCCMLLSPSEQSNKGSLCISNHIKGRTYICCAGRA